MGGSASMCLGRPRPRKYRVNEPHGASRNDVFATYSDFGMNDDVFYIGYRRDFEENSKVTKEDIDRQQKELMKEVEAELRGETEKSLVREDGHIHEPLSQGVDEVDTNHPDLPQGVTCVTCAATMMEIDQSKEETVQEKDNSEAEEKNDDADGAPDGSESSENKEKSDEDENQPCLGKGPEIDEDSASGDKLSHGTRRRRRYKALSNVPPAVMRPGVY